MSWKSMLLIFGVVLNIVVFIILIVKITSLNKTVKKQKIKENRPKRNMESNSVSNLHTVEKENDKDNIVSLLTDLLNMSFSSLSLIEIGNKIIYLLSDYYRVDYVTLYIKEKDGWFSTLSTNMPTYRLRKTERYYNKESQVMMADSKVTVMDWCDEGGYLSSNNIEYSNFTLIKKKGKTIGAILLEHSNKDEIEKNNQFELYDKVFNATALVLSHLIEVSDLVKKVSTDQLTNVYNRRYIDITLEEEVIKHSRLNQTFHVGLMDIDYFKKFNDTYGHQFGDEVLKVVSKYIKDKLGTHSWVARYGGEEFLVFVANSDVNKVRLMIDGIREGISKLQVEYGGQVANVTVSFGISGFPKDGGNAESIVANADRALYQSKENGRNQVTVWGVD